MKTKAVVAYVPAIHSGYTNLINEQDPSSVFVLDKSLVLEVPRLERDIRAFSAQTAQAALKGIFPNLDISILTASELTNLDALDQVVMPEEDVTRALHDNHFSTTLKSKSVFIPTFLRWDMTAVNTHFVPSPDEEITEDAFARSIMHTISVDATKSPDWWRQVSAMLIPKIGNTIIRHNAPYPTEHNTFETFGDPRSNFDAGQNIEMSKALHAEAAVIAEAAKKGVATQGGELYVTTFPCPVCAKSIAASGIARVFYREGYSLLDAKDVLKSEGTRLIRVVEPKQ